MLTDLRFLYPEAEAQAAYQAIHKLIAHYQSQLHFSQSALTEKDNLLICYGDHVTRAGEAPLKSLHLFTQEMLAPEVTGVHILPFFPYTSDDGFSVQDYKAVHPNWGQWNDIQAFAKDFRLMFDAVINHISKSSAWFQGYLTGEKAYENFFHSVDPSRDYSEVVRPRALPLFHPFEDANGETRHIWTTFSEDQVDLNYGNWRVLLAVLDVLLFYVSQGAALLRLDAIGFMWKKLGTTSIHLPEAHRAIQLMRHVIEQLAPDVQLITETNVPHKENISYFGNGLNEAHGVYNFTLPPLLAYSILKGNAEQLSTWATSLELPSDQTFFFNFTASHDGVGLRPLEGILPKEEVNILEKACLEHGGCVSYRHQSDGSKSPYELNCSYINLLTHPDAPQAEKVARMLLSQAIMLAMPGLPGIYFHSIVGSENDHKGLAQTGHNRTINREKLDWEQLMQELQTAGSLRHAIFTAYKHILAVRGQQPAFHPQGGFEVVSLHPAVFAIRRMSPNGSTSVLCLHNVSGEKLSIGKIEGEDLFEIHASEVENLLPYQYRWIQEN